MSVMLERKVSVTVDVNVDVIECKSGDLVGTAIEYPVVVQGSDMEEMKTKMLTALDDYFKWHSEEMRRKFARE